MPPGEGHIFIEMTFETTIQDIRLHCFRINANVLHLLEIAKPEATCKSFRALFMEIYITTVKNADSWPSGILIGRFWFGDAAGTYLRSLANISSDPSDWQHTNQSPLGIIKIGWLNARSIRKKNSTHLWYRPITKLERIGDRRDIAEGRPGWGHATYPMLQQQYGPPLF